MIIIFEMKVADKIKTRFIFSFFFENRAVYEIMWKNVVEPDSLQMTIYGACVVHAG
jgi:hypothetical protein